MSQALIRYKEHMLGSGRNKSRSAEDALYRLGKFFTNTDARMRTMTPARCAAMYDEMKARPRVMRLAGKKTKAGPPMAADTRLDILAAVKTFFRWAVSAALVSVNPADAIRDDTKRNHGGIGRTVLRAKELRSFYGHACAKADGGDERAVAVLMALVLGMRSSEIVNCKVRDVDDIDWKLEVPIESAKTNASARVFVIPEALRPHLTRLIRGKGGEAFVFGDGQAAHWRDWVSESVRRICVALKLPEIESAHGLRGAHNDLARMAGNTGEEVVRQLGHESEKTTARSYTSEMGKRAISAGRQRQVLSVLAGGKSPAGR